VSGPRVYNKGQRVAARQLMDIAPTLLTAYGLAVPQDMQGSAIPW